MISISLLALLPLAQATLVGQHPEYVLNSVNHGPSSLSGSEVHSWLPRPLFRVRLEVDQDVALQSLKRGSSIEERTKYWELRADELSFAAFSEEVLEEIRALVEWRHDHPLVPRVRELWGLIESGDATQEERDEYVQAHATVMEELNQQTGLMLSLTVRSGMGDDFYRMADMLTDDLLPAFRRQEATLGASHEKAAWALVAAHTDPRSMDLIRREFDARSSGTPRRMSETATEAIVIMAGGRQFPGSEQLLVRVLSEGSHRERCAAIVNSGWMSDAQYRDTMNQVIQADGKSLSRTERIIARDSFFAGLNSRKSSKLRRALLVNTVKSGRWSDPNSSRFWGEGVAARTALKSLDKETLDAFKAAGKIHRSLW